MTTRPEDVGGAIRRIEARSRADSFQWARAVRTADLRTILASHATLAADLDTAENALVSQTALVRSQAERIASLEAALRDLIGHFPLGRSFPELAAARALLSGKASA